MFVQSYLVFNNILKTLAQQYYLFIANGTIFKRQYSFVLDGSQNIHL